LAPSGARAVDAAHGEPAACRPTTSLPGRLALRLATRRCAEGGSNQVRAVIEHRVSSFCLAVHAGRLLDRGGSRDVLVQEGLLLRPAGSSAPALGTCISRPPIATA